jgi:hypothetical protein
MEKGKKEIDVRVCYNVVERRKIIYLRFGGNCHSFFISILSLSVHTFIVTHTIQSSVFIRRGLSPFSSLLLCSEEKPPRDAEPRFEKDYLIAKGLKQNK